MKTVSPNKGGVIECDGHRWERPSEFCPKCAPVSHRCVIIILLPDSAISRSSFMPAASLPLWISLSLLVCATLSLRGWYSASPPSSEDVVSLSSSSVCGVEVKWKGERTAPCGAPLLLTGRHTVLQGCMLRSASQQSQTQGGCLPASLSTYEPEEQAEWC